MKKSPKKKVGSGNTSATAKKTVKKKATKKKASSPQTSDLQQIPEPETDTDARADRVLPGQPIPPLTRVRTFSPEQWEEFIQEWSQSLKEDYHTVMRCGGAGDMGRDVVAFTGKPSSNKPWDNYQCKHYDHSLYPSDAWLELGKLAYYTFKKNFSIPREYSFVCPHDVGTSLARLIEEPEKLRAGLIENWDKYCQEQITDASSIPLTGELRKWVQTFPFKIVSFLPVLKVIEQHQRTRWHVHRFGGGLPDRPKPDEPPATLGHNELKYVAELLKAYSDFRGCDTDQAGLASVPKLNRHFLLSRASFYSAEALKQFSRDHLPENEFARLQNEIEDGIQETYLDEHDHGYLKVIEVTKAAVHLPITDHPLLSVLQPPDRRGICHQLVDMDKLKWVEDHA
ncbi:ABC-three component system protein [Rubinisphaera sp. JC750]|uniref:ABC-three component system protein n=1 Tax=Rubinisphaera sp. JC750 TaxID=2898658 RepID=UPI001F326FD6|nr:ABC-three component system protein [Rubinisphaera sp. JC750]